MGKMPPGILLSTIILLIMELGRNSIFGCIEGERKALLRFKASVVDRSNRLSSWNRKNIECCAWQGVACNDITGHVIRLDLSYNLLDKPYDGDSIEYDKLLDNRLKGKTIDSSLLELKYLSYLDLSWNDFRFSKIPSFLGSMRQLQHLNLTYTNLTGVVPHHLGNISNLRALDLSCPYGELIVDDLRWVSNLSFLEHLQMKGVDLSSTKDPFKVLNMLPSLRKLSLLGTQFSNAHLPPPQDCENTSLLTNVGYLDLSDNLFHGEFPCFIQHMTALSFLNVFGNKFNFSGTFHLRRLKNLGNLNLAYNSISHKVEWISELLLDKCHLKSLDLSGNGIYGDISGLLSGCWSHNLETLYLSQNRFHGHLPRELSEFQQLRELDLSQNGLSGEIPSLVGDLRSLRELNLGSNQLRGRIPVSLGQLSNLERIDISYNSFEGTLSEAHFAKLSKLVYLRVESTMLRFGVGNDWVPPFQLRYFTMTSTKLGGQFPEWLQTQKALTHLYLPNCSITGTLPKWVHSLNLSYLDLSHNNITGPIPELASAMISLDLSNNMITHQLPSNIGHAMPLLQALVLAQNFINGTIPDSLCELRGLTALDLSKNHLSGNLPDCWPNFKYLQVARLSFNELSGFIPDSIGGAQTLWWLHLNDNNLTGKLPSTLKNCTGLTLLDVGGNSLSGKLPEWIGKDVLSLEVVRVRNNEFYGTIPSMYCQLSQLRVMDLANNKLTGNIPHCFGNLSSMIKEEQTVTDYYAEWNRESLSQAIGGAELEYTTNSKFVVNMDLSSNYLIGEIPSELTALSGLIGLNLSHNHLRGEIPATIGDLESLESLDFSINNLFGKIPDSLSNLSYLSHLNLSNNNLSGQIPMGRQLQTLDDPSIYEGNPQLCGAPLPKKCLKDEATKASNHEEGDENAADKAWFYAVIVAGFATGFWGLIGVLVVKTSWRQAYFRFIEGVADKMLGYY